MTWAVTQAKAKFSEVLDKAEAEGPQLVRRRKREFYVMTREQREADHTATGVLDDSAKPAGTLGGLFSKLAFGGVRH